MNRIFQWKKSIPVFLAAVFLTAGLMCSHMVTAWATPVSGTASGDDVRVHASAVDGEMIGSLSGGQEVSIEDETTGSDGMTWYQITYEVNGQEITGWVRSDLLVTSDDDTGTDAETADESDVSFIAADSIPAEVIPEGFAETTITYAGAEVPALYSEVRNLYLLYAVNAEDETDAGLFVYDDQNEEWIPYVQFDMQDGSVILINIPEEEQQFVADRFVLTECTFAHGSIPAYQLSEPDELVAEDASIVDYYYVFGVNEVGETGWYIYNAAEGSIQKNVTSMQYSLASADGEGSVDTEENTDTTFSTDSLIRMVVAVLAVICLLLLVLAIIFSVRYRRLRNILEDETDNQIEYKEEPESEKKHFSEKSQRDPAEPVKTEKKEKKPADESRDGIPGRRTEPGELHLFSDDVDVMDLDSMEDEDYETLLNKYLDENFSDEEEGEDNPESDTPDVVLPEDDDQISEAAGTDMSAEDRFLQNIVKSEELAADEPAVNEPVSGTGENDAPSSKTNAADSLDEDYDMPEFLKADIGIQEFDDMDLDISTSGRSDQKTRGES